MEFKYSDKCLINYQILRGPSFSDSVMSASVIKNDTHLQICSCSVQEYKDLKQIWDAL